jgi:ABC-type polysaccharide/polyol phosphate export permease
MACGVLVWAAASESLSRATLSITDHAGLVKRQAFLTELLPLQAVLVEHLFLLAGLASFVAVGATLAALGVPGGVVPGAALLVGAPAALCAGLVLTYGLGLALAALQVVVRDTQHALGVALTFGMFATPVFWVPAALPGIEPWLSWIEANPLHQLLVAWRGALLGGVPLRAVLASSGYVLACGTALLIAGHALFRHLAPEFADEV